MKLRWILAVGVAGLIVAGGTLATAQEKKEEGEGSFWMQKKLEYSQKILAGLATADFDAIAKNARSMKTLSQMENWVRGKLPEYRSQLRNFQRANDELIETAEAGQLDGATLAYVQLALSCVNCHKVVRDTASPKPSGGK